MKALAGIGALAMLLAACTGGEAATDPVDTSAPGSTTTSVRVTTTSSVESSFVCWTAPTAGDGGPIVLSESTEAMGLVEPLIGLHGHAAAFGDVDGDNVPDLLVGTFGDREPEAYQFRGATGPASDQLLISAREPSALLIDELGRTSAGVFGDLDGDGDEDLLLIRHAGRGGSAVPSRLYEAADTALTAGEVPLPSGFYGRTPAVADFDGDGLLDVYVSEDKHGTRGGILLHNLGALDFSDVTEGSGLEGAFALGATAADLNDDSKPDLITSRNIFINQGNLKFLDATPAWFVAEPAGNEDDPAGVAVGDINRDGIPDVVLGQHNRLTVETDLEAPIRLFVGLGPDSDGVPQFEEVTDQAGLTPLPTLAPHVHIADIDNDGWPDILTSASAAQGALPAIFRNTGAPNVGFETPDGLGSDQYWVGAPIVDLDRDGRLDIFALEWEPSLGSLMLMNEGDSGHWLEVSVSGPGRGVGAVVSVSNDDELIGRQEIGVGGGYASGHLPVAHFGLGPIDRADVTIQFPDGQTIQLEDVAADSHIRWPEGCA